MMTVSLEAVRLNGYHGLYEQERHAGNEFELNLSVSYPERVSVHSIGDTVDYTVLYAIVQDHMHKPVPLLEELAEAIAADVKARFPFISEINMTISKLHPPIVNFQGRVAVTLHKKFDHA
jgi:7,8-dihydroneopterin aldolase/epimerase/oxygenase